MNNSIRLYFLTIRILVLIPLIFITQIVIGQNECNCCDKEYSSFDFWIGKWQVLDSAASEVGIDEVVKSEGNCLITEKWNSKKGITGSSFNYYNPLDSTWNQSWVDSRGNILELKGGLFKDGHMILRSDLVQGKQTRYYHQLSWIKQTSNRMKQVWEVYDENNNLIYKVFEGFYNRIDE